MADKSRSTFWKEKRNITRNPLSTSQTIKNEKGERQYNPESIKEHTAQYYEHLYKKKPYDPQPYHQEIKNKMIMYSAERDHENLNYNRTPTEEEIHNIISNKTNGKSTTDIKNEMLKRPGEKMSKFLYTMIKTIWEEENIPRCWNRGQITSIYKGKGDREMLKNHRGITTSSSIGTILDAALDTRIEHIVPFTQAQGGGKKGSSTCDHLFIIRAIIDMSIKEKRPTFLTFYDVSKAYDNVDNNDMLTIIWEKGLRGKTWRILKNLSKELTATAKTRHGLTREISMEIGGKQGSRLTGRLFSKLMDMLSEEFEAAGEGYKLTTEFIIAVLLWVDDVVSCADGIENQLKTLERINSFAKNHKLKWGQDKCRVLQIGKHKETPIEWKIGSMPIEKSDSYKYLGDVLTSDGKNTKNIADRKSKMKSSIITINTIAANEIINKIETTILLDLHEKINIPSLLANSEAWCLSKGERDELEKIETQTLKELFDLPIHTPTTAIIYTLGTLFTSLRLDQKQLMYLHKLLNRHHTHWTHKTFQTLKNKDIGWSKNIRNTLNKYNLPTDFQVIKATSHNEWKRKVTAEIEKDNIERLKNECYKVEKGNKIEKTKTKSIIKHITKQEYTRGPPQELQYCNKHETKTIIIARYRMLECGSNFKGTIREICDTCQLVDDETHRLNYCKAFKDVNFYESDIKIDFDDIYSTDIDILRELLPKIEKVWNTRNANGSMNV